MDETNVLDAKEWLAYAQSDLGVAKHLYDRYYPKSLEIKFLHETALRKEVLKHYYYSQPKRL